MKTQVQSEYVETSRTACLEIMENYELQHVTQEIAARLHLPLPRRPCIC